MSVSSGTRTKRSTVTRAQEHDRKNSFCAAHPEVSSRRPSPVDSDREAVEINYRRTGRNEDGLRAHVRATHVMVTKTKKK